MKKENIRFLILFRIWKAINFSKELKNKNRANAPCEALAESSFPFYIRAQVWGLLLPH